MYSKHIILNTYSKSICEVKNTTLTYLLRFFITFFLSNWPISHACAKATPSNHDIITCYVSPKKHTKYITVPAKYISYNKTVNASSLSVNSSLEIHDNGTHTAIYTVERKLVYSASNTVPAGTKINPRGSMNVLGIVVFSIIFGLMLGRVGEKGQPLKAFFEALNEVIMKMITLIMW